MQHTTMLGACQACKFECNRGCGAPLWLCDRRQQGRMVCQQSGLGQNQTGRTKLTVRDRSQYWLRSTWYPTVSFAVLILERFLAGCVCVRSRIREHPIVS